MVMYVVYATIHHYKMDIIAFLTTGGILTFVLFVVAMYTAVNDIRNMDDPDYVPRK